MRRPLNRKSEKRIQAVPEASAPAEELSRAERGGRQHSASRSTVDGLLQLREQRFFGAADESPTRRPLQPNKQEGRRSVDTGFCFYSNSPDHELPGFQRWQEHTGRDRGKRNTFAK